jgi:hypothetical protein
MSKQPIQDERSKRPLPNLTFPSVTPSEAEKKPSEVDLTIPETGLVIRIDVTLRNREKLIFCQPFHSLIGAGDDLDRLHGSAITVENYVADVVRHIVSAMTSYVDKRVNANKETEQKALPSPPPVVRTSEGAEFLRMQMTQPVDVLPPMESIADVQQQNLRQAKEGNP